MGMTGQPAAAMSVSKLVQRHAFESPVDLEKELQQAFSSLQALLTPPYNLSHSSTNPPHLLQALLYAILTNPSPAASSYLHQLTALTAVTGDGYAPFVALLLRLVNECYSKLLEQPRNQVLWLLRQLITFNATEIDNLCATLLRQVAGGDLSNGNVWLATELLDVMQTYEQWFYDKPHLFTMALYTYLRLLPDHTMGKTPTLNDLKHKESMFCIKILRERFQDCLVIGRDLIRLLQDVALLPEFEPIWRDLLSNPASFKAPGFTDIGQLYVVRTPTRYLASRVTPDMETQIKFMLTSVRMGSQRRYQTWFAQRYLFTVESETLVCDLIRFICCVIHPTNQILQSDIVPRWAIVGWLLKCCKSNHVEANAKLALFYDWLFFMPKADNIMNIEPAILLMVHSIPKYVDMTHSLLEFLFLLVENYDPSRRELIQKGVTASIDILVGKGVVRSLEPLAACHLVSPALREKLNLYFASYCKPDNGEGPRQFRPEPTLPDGFPPGKGNAVGSYVPAPSFGGDAPSMLVAVQGSETSGSSLDESNSRKRRRPGASEALLSEVQVHLDGLAEALTQSQEIAVTALEKLFASFLSASDQISSGKLSKMEMLLHLEGSADSSTANHTSDLFSSSSLAELKFATQVVNIFKKGGYEMFGPLTKLPSEKPDGDETMSLTSTLLRLYVVNNHPQLRQLLVAWHREGLAVGPRLLCYVSRLAEEVEPSVTGSPGSMTGTGGAEVEKLADLCSRMEEEGYDTGRASAGPEADEDGEVTGNSGKPSREHRENGGGGSVFGWQRCGNNSAGNFFLKSHLRDAGLRASVVSAFKAYEDFLRQTSKGSSLPQAGELNSNPSANHNAVKSNSRVTDGKTSPLVKVEGTDMEAESTSKALITHLETCFVWNTQRLLRVLPSVFRYLRHLATGREEIVLLLISTIDPVDLFNYEVWLTLGEFAVMGGDAELLARLIKASLSWESVEQQYFWRLMVAELQAASPSTALQVVESCLAVVNPQSNTDALSGLTSLLRSQAPTGALLSAVLSLAPKFGRFVAIALAGWMSSHNTLLLSCLQQLCASSSLKDGSLRKSEDNVENNSDKTGLRRPGKMSGATMAVFLSAFDDSGNGRAATDEKTALCTGEVRRALLQLIGSGGYVGAQGVDSSHGPVEAAGENS